MPHADHSDEVHSRAVVALANRKPVEVQLLYPDMGISEPLAAVADRYDLDREALHAAAQFALGDPDRVVVLEVAARALRLTGARRRPVRSDPTRRRSSIGRKRCPETCPHLGSSDLRLP